MRVVIANGDEVYREGLKSVFSTVDWITVVAEADDGAELVAILEQVETDAVVLSAGSPAELDVVHRVRDTTPGVPVVVVAATHDHAYLREALELAAEGYLLTSARPHEFLAALSRVARDERYLQTEWAGALVDTPARVAERLSLQQLRILHLVAQGLRNKQVAAKLGISETTVKYHLRTIYAQLDATSRVEAVAAALRTGLVE